MFTTSNFGYNRGDKYVNKSEFKKKKYLINTICNIYNEKRNITCILTKNTLDNVNILNL